MQKLASTPSRRSFLVRTASIVAAPMVLGASRAQAQTNTVRLSSYGGSYWEFVTKAVLDPFTQETGIKVQNVPYPGLDKVKAMLMTGDIGIDVYLSTGAEAAGGSKLGYWEKFPAGLFDLQDLKPGPTSDYIAFSIFCRGISWDPKKFGPGKYPVNLADFFNPQKFPGPRSIRSYSQMTLEMALVGDGVAPKNLYPLDVNRALKALDRIKPQLVWAANAAQDISLVQVGQANYGITNCPRVRVTNEPGGGVPLSFSFDQVLNGTNVVSVLKGSPNKDAAMKLIAFWVRPDVQAKFINLTYEIPVSKKAAGMVSPEVAKWLPDMNSPRHITLNDTYWADNFETVNKRFLEWKLT